MFSSNLLAFCSQKRWKLLTTSFLKECQYIKNKVAAHNMDDLESSPDDSDDSGDSDGEQIKDMKLMFLEKTIFENVIFEERILKMYSGCLSS